MEVKLKSPDQPNPVIHDVLNALPGRCGAVLHYYYLENIWIFIPQGSILRTYTL